MQENIDKDLSDIFSDSPLESELQVNLPSMGKFYSNKVATVTLRPLVFEDEKSIALASRGKKSVGAINTLLAKCIIDQDSTFVSELLLIDKVFLILKLREISYGKDYQAKVTCPECNVETPSKIDISQFHIDYVDDIDSEPVEVDLPIIKKKASVRLARVKDEQIFDNAGLLINSLWKYVVTLAGKDNPIVISKAIQKLPMSDASLLIEASLLAGYGVNNTVAFLCPACEVESVTEVPISADFFSQRSQAQET